MSQAEDDVDARVTDAGDSVGERSHAENTAPPDEKISEIRESIEHTRADMSETIDELQERLSPARLKEQVKEQVLEHYKHARESVRDATIGKVEDMAQRASDTMYETRRTIVDTVSANPIPSALVGIGLVWLWMNRRSDSAGRGYDDSRGGARRYDDSGRRYDSAGSSGDWQQNAWDRTPDAGRTLADRTKNAVSGAAGQIQEAAGTLAGKAKATVTGAAGQVQEAATHLAGKAKATVSGVVDQAQQSAGRFADEAQHQAQRVEERFSAALRENPLAIGAVALALGTAVGLAVPQTRKENEWMGDARDTLMDKAQSVAQDAMDQVQQVAQKVTDEIADGARPQ